MAYTTATLDIGNFHTRLTLTAATGPRQRINVIPAGPVPDKHVPYFRDEADLQIALHGYTRTGKWVHDPSRGDVHTAAIKPIDH